MENELEVSIAWENGIGFKVTAKSNADDAVTVIEADENGEIAALWKHYQDAIERFLKVKLEKVGLELMRQ